MINKVKKIALYFSLILILFMVINAITIYRYSFEYSEQKSDVAIVLGAGTNNGEISPIFRERINHGIYLYKNQRVDKLLFTGGYGNNQSISDSRLAKDYAIQQGVPANDILIEEKSRYTHENITEAKRLMETNGLNSALIVSDPLHMKRSMAIVNSHNINGLTSPTPTTMYRSAIPKFKSLMYETFYYTMGVTMFRF